MRWVEVARAAVTAGAAEVMMVGERAAGTMEPAAGSAASLEEAVAGVGWGVTAAETVDKVGEAEEEAAGCSPTAG